MAETESRKRGAKIHGKPCKVCKGVLRYKSNNKCITCLRNNKRPYNREAQRKYRQSEKGQKAYRELLEARRNDKDFRRRQRKSELVRLFNVTLDDYDAMLRRQDGKCAICVEAPTKHNLSIDHDHHTGKVRGLLCGNCNRALGLFRDNVSRLRRAITYLETSNIES